MRAQDIYKLVHQGVFGPGHIIASAARARQGLKQEMAALEARSPKSKVRSQSEPELEAIEPRGRLVRVNLRPLFGEGGGRYADWLVEALVVSARSVKGNPVQMNQRLAAAVRWCRGNLPRQAAELEQMAARAGESDFPAFHHSVAYSRAYRPAYRVILSDCLRPRASGRAG